MVNDYTVFRPRTVGALDMGGASLQVRGVAESLPDHLLKVSEANPPRNIKPCTYAVSTFGCYRTRHNCIY